MPFDLPRNSRDLRFTGEVLAAIEEQAPRLGQRRPRQVPPARQSSRRDVYRPDPVAMPFMAPQPSPASFAGFDEDDAPTTMLDRDGRDVIAGGFAALASEPARSERQRKATPIPNFRTAPEVPSVIVAPDTVRRATTSHSPPLTIWLAAAVILALLSYKLAPVAITQADAMVRLLDTKTSSQ